MPEVALSAGTISYEDTGGSGPVIVLVPGLAMDGSLYRDVIAELRADYRCIVPTLPLGGHRLPMREHADLSPRGIARLESEFLEALDLRDVVLVGNDSGLFLFTAAADQGRIAHLVISACEAFDNFPPGLPGKNLVLAAKVPGGLTLAIAALRLRPMRRSPLAFGWMTRRPIPHELTDRWLAPLLNDRHVRRDLKKYLLAAKKGEMMAAAEALRSFDRPALVIWGKDDRVMPPEHGRRLAQLIPNARLEELEDCGTLVPLDQPLEFARLIREFVATATRPGQPNTAVMGESRE